MGGSHRGRRAIRDRHDGQHWIETAIRYVDAAVDYVKVVEIVDAAERIYHRRLRVSAHTAGSRLVLSAAQPPAGNFHPGAFRPRGPEPRLGLARHGARDFQRMRVAVA